MKTIKVTGKAKMVVTPEVTKVKLTMRSFAKEYGDALAKTVEDTKIIKDTIESCGIERESLKTEDFYTSEKTKTVKDQYGNSSTHHIGYDVIHSLSFTFLNNNKLLGDVLFKLSKLSINPRIDVSYLLYSINHVKDSLIRFAVDDAIRKAGIITSTAKVELGDIVNIDYSFKDSEWESRPYLTMDGVSICKMAKSFDIDINPEDVDVFNQITIEWEIK